MTFMSTMTDKYVPEDYRLKITWGKLQDQKHSFRLFLSPQKIS